MPVCPRVTPVGQPYDMLTCTPSLLRYGDLPCTEANLDCFIFQKTLYEEKQAALGALIALAPDPRDRRSLRISGAVPLRSTFQYRFDWCRSVALAISGALMASNARYPLAAQAVSAISTVSLNTTTARKKELFALVPDSFPRTTGLVKTWKRAAAAGGVTGELVLPFEPVSGVPASGQWIRYIPTYVGYPAGWTKRQWTSLSVGYDRAREIFLRFAHGSVMVTHGWTYRKNIFHPQQVTRGGNMIPSGDLTVKYYKTWAQELINISFEKFALDSLKRWEQTYVPYIEAGITGMSTSQFADFVVAMSRQQTSEEANAVFESPLVKAGAESHPAAKAIKDIAKAVTAFFTKHAAVGGWQCPQPPFLRTLGGEDCVSVEIMGSAVPPETKVADLFQRVGPRAPPVGQPPGAEKTEEELAEEARLLRNKRLRTAGAVVLGGGALVLAIRAART